VFDRNPEQNRYRKSLDINPVSDPFKEREGHLPARRMSMRKLKEVLRLRLEPNFDQRQIARNCSMSVSTAHEYLKRAAAVG